jgi:hypothetical protein
VKAPPLLWIQRALWLTVPFTLAPALQTLTDTYSDGTRIAVLGIFWLVWAVSIAASLIPLPVTLTVVRFATPLAPVAALVTAFDEFGWEQLGAIIAGAAAAALAMSAIVGDWFIDGASYGPERRFGVKAPVALLLGPIQLTWVFGVLPLLAGILLLSAEQWIVGAVLTLVGALLLWWAFLAAWRLTQRWAVLVPAGLTIVDDIALAEPILFPKSELATLGPAHVDSEGLDLSVGAPGLVVEAAFKAATEVTPAATRQGGVAEPTDCTAILFVPSLPGAFLAHAEEAGLPVTRV